MVSMIVSHWIHQSSGMKCHCVWRSFRLFLSKIIIKIRLKQQAFYQQHKYKAFKRKRLDLQIVA